MAGGSYGAVFDIDVVNRRKHARHNVALKVITIGSVKTAAGRRLKEETLSEMHFGQMPYQILKDGTKIKDLHQITTEAFKNGWFMTGDFGKKDKNNKD